jgi:hypothetical protein
MTLSINEIQFLIDCMWGHTRHDSQAMAFKYGINDVDLEKRLSHLVADNAADSTNT